MDWLLWLGGGAAALLAVDRAIRAFIGLWANAVGAVIDKTVGPDISYIKAELSPNHGTSMKDAVTRLDRWSAVVDVRLAAVEEFIPYQHERNHDVVNHLTSIKGFMELEKMAERLKRES